MTKSNELGENIQTDFTEKMTYSDYLQLDRLLSSQTRLSNHHDEMLFIIIHQVSELWMKLILHELQASILALQQKNFATSLKILSRVSKIQSQIIESWDVLTTLTPSEYTQFRDKLGNASGFQSYQYRMIEFTLGYKPSHILDIYKDDQSIFSILSQAFNSPSIYDVTIQLLNSYDFPIDKHILSRDYSNTYEKNESVESAWLQVYKETNKYWDLYELGEKLVDLEDCIQQWKFRHMKTVERIIGFKTGTGGSSGVSYLKKVIDQRYFPELHSIRTIL
ncbi:tryptophan 2,3-dioxygenase [Bacillus carboniphilus]|uniref:Tryptophan 2,3-dioxygenase n=1 Tax=Bacillus carboniphilus TaxID=86663 RepID=A0ABY9JWZ2_9BACI|nr:tryptophan 2,3-dioxygenase [Bacillus carboniphilus]WLR43022.1 tryptophan 2,3-dioxygenase [Bacillus carboniphilus]